MSSDPGDDPLGPGTIEIDGMPLPDVFGDLFGDVDPQCLVDRLGDLTPADLPDFDLDGLDLPFLDELDLGDLDLDGLDLGDLDLGELGGEWMEPHVIVFDGDLPSFIDFGDGDGSVTITKTGDEITVTTDGDVTVEQLDAIVDGVLEGLPEIDPNDFDLGDLDLGDLDLGDLDLGDSWAIWGIWGSVSSATSSPPSSMPSAQRSTPPSTPAAPAADLRQLTCGR